MEIFDFFKMFYFSNEWINEFQEYCLHGAFQVNKTMWNVWNSSIIRKWAGKYTFYVGVISTRTCVSCKKWETGLNLTVIYLAKGTGLAKRLKWSNNILNYCPLSTLKWVSSRFNLSKFVCWLVFCFKLTYWDS